MYFPMHATVENAVAELLFAIEEGDECLAVVVGEVGLGKTMSLRVTLDSLDLDKYRIAFVTNPDLTFPQIMREIVGQLMNETCNIKSKDALLEKFNNILFETADEGKRVLIFIDEGNAIRRINLQSLRLLTNMQEDDRNLFTMILAGQPELGRNLERPAMANLYQRIGVYCKLQKMDSAEVIKDYIDHRMECAGSKKRVFTDAAIEKIWEYSEFGVPRLVNRMCKLALKAGETNKLDIIDEDVIIQIGERFARSSTRPKSAPKPKPAKAEKQVELKAAEKSKQEVAERTADEITVVDDVNIPEQLDDASEKNPQSHKEIIVKKKKELRNAASPGKDILGRMKERHRNLRSTNLFFR